MSVMVRALLLAFVSLILLACSDAEVAPSKPAAEQILTRTDGALLINGYFGLTMPVPAGWYSQNAEETMALQRMASPMLSGSDRSRQALIEAAMASTVPVFGLFELPPGTPGKLNPNLIANAENLQAVPGLASGCDYLANASELLRQSSFEIVALSDCRQQLLAGRTFAVMDSEMRYGKQPIFQRIHVLMVKPYALSVVTTWFDDSSRQQVEAALAQLTMAEES
ncbi:MAG: hypothetical protein II007_04220 [Gammaproteobacteria bacterium]|nr:hypothetical protein [Gammaproteobacteria bacterium]